MVIDYIQDHQFAAWLDEPPVLYHSDLEPEHVLLIETKGRWAISGLIDYANTQTGLREFDLKEVYAHLLEADAEAMGSFMAGYSPDDRDQGLCHKCLIAFLCFQQGIVSGWLENFIARAGSPEIATIQDLQDVLFPPIG